MGQADELSLSGRALTAVALERGRVLEGAALALLELWQHGGRGHVRLRGMPGRLAGLLLFVGLRALWPAPLAQELLQDMSRQH